MKVTYTRVLARKVLLAFLSFIIILSITALFVRDSITKKLESISKLANGVETDRSRPEQALLLLHESEDDFQESLINANSKKSIDYKLKLSKAFDKIDTLLKEKADTTQLTDIQRNKIKLWHQKKLNLSDKLSVLRHNFDSLLTVYAGFNTNADENQRPLNTKLRTNTKYLKNSSDTIRKGGQKRGLIKRLKDAFTNKDGGSAGVIEITHNKNSKENDLTAQKIVTANKIAYDKKLQQLQQQNVSLLNTQRELIILNTHISNEIEQIINDVKDINNNISNEFKGVALKDYQDSTALLNKFYLVALFLVLAFATLLIVFIVQLNESEVLLRTENERSVNIAQQKMDLLLHMSHEVRNPLTAINGLLYILSKSNLSQRQVEMLDSIKLSSEMLLRTLNDTLDAAKMENSEFKINHDPFSPDFTLRTVVESMEFSAAKKELTLGYNFKGDKDVILLGDSFRLEQIMVNLLSNAIKYTNKGGVTINAEIVGPENKLQIDIVDTGMGISPEQQVSLFSKYYQTSSSKGKVGTGLGLFICKKLVELQNGKITVKSKLEVGTTFSFFIPYQKTSNKVADKQTIEDPISVLNNITILAVDDNELNLMFLKKIMDKWNVKFLQASNGKEAIDIISKNMVTVVLTDLQMPVMDGKKLIASIRKLEPPKNRIPAIVISGAESVDEEKLVKLGFAGMIRKPFVETELVKELVKILSNRVGH
ncbi:MAG: hybrid sensor histidine kinase/response regulator [Mucilaginibacter sp.]